MPNDATHRIINYLMLSIFIILNFYFNIQTDFSIILIFTGAYILGTEIFSPDLNTRSKPGKRLGILAYPIRKLSRHRGLGHNILIGWFLKIIYIFLILAIIYFITERLGYDLSWTFKFINYNTIGAFASGLFLSNAMHIIADHVF